jgi:hypothetical protein
VVSGVTHCIRLGSDFPELTFIIYFAGSEAKIANEIFLKPVRTAHPACYVLIVPAFINRPQPYPEF